MYMWPHLILIFMSLLNIVTTRTEPMDFTDVGMSEGINREQQKDIFSSGRINSISNDYSRSNELAKHHRKINLNNDKNNPRDWNERETRRLYEDPLRKITDLADIDDAVLDDYDAEEATHSIDELNETDRLDRLTIYLTKLLEQPSWQAPLIIVNEPTTSFQESEETELRPNVWKKSRGYRRYPWKRQNSRSRHTYDYDTAYYCMPSRDDVFQLLVALHNVRQGDRFRNVHFCNRQRSAGTLFTSIRFLGRRK